jgi:nitrite reductase/ring-hydroxylating ferredoxin subunit
LAKDANDDPTADACDSGPDSRVPRASPAVAAAGEALEWVAAEWLADDGGAAGAPGESRAAAALARGRRVVVCRAGGRLYALLDRCPHASEPLSGGALRGFALECPYHGGRLDVRDGRPLGLPIRRPGTTLPVREVGGRVEIGLAPDDGETQHDDGPERQPEARRTPCTTS